MSSFPAVHCGDGALAPLHLCLSPVWMWSFCPLLWRSRGKLPDAAVGVCGRRGVRDLPLFPPRGSHLLIFGELNLKPVLRQCFLSVFSFPASQAGAALRKQDNLLMYLEPFHLEHETGLRFQGATATISFWNHSYSVLEKLKACAGRGWGWGGDRQCRNAPPLHAGAHVTR